MLYLYEILFLRRLDNVTHAARWEPLRLRFVFRGVPVQRINYHLLALAAIVFVTVFSGWSYSTATMSSWSVAYVQQPDDIPWD